MSYLLPHLHSGWAVDQAILAEEERRPRLGRNLYAGAGSYILKLFYRGVEWNFRCCLSLMGFVLLISGLLPLGLCVHMDEVLGSVAETIKNFAVIYLVDITEVPDFNTMYELYDPSTVMFFFRNKHIMIDLGTGNNNN
ncbi:hypothetical protein DITRI_Ditri08aG0073800 [Diplodiscus trichospermus]